MRPQPHQAPGRSRSGFRGPGSRGELHDLVQGQCCLFRLVLPLLQASVSWCSKWREQPLPEILRPKKQLKSSEVPQREAGAEETSLFLADFLEEVTFHLDFSESRVEGEISG